MPRVRVQAIAIQNDRVLFGYGKGYHFFPGGGLERGETPEQGALRELKEEANVSGTILFCITEPATPDTLASESDRHFTFLVDIDDQTPRLGTDPEETDTGDRISLAGLELIPLDHVESFTRIDVDYFESLVSQCRGRNTSFPWLGKMEKLIAIWRPQ
jgi:8-oxo-dGTP pyrophosphatase MutT (NUDIX family)